jgi:hypothetical protein
VICTEQGKDPRRLGDIQGWVRGLAIYEERWVKVGPLKLRDIPSSVKLVAGDTWLRIKEFSAQEPLAEPLIPRLGCRCESRHQIVRPCLFACRAHLKPKTPCEAR